jgi:hypothetical protein
MICQTLTASGVIFSWHEFNAAHAFLPPLSGCVERGQEITAQTPRHLQGTR